MSCKIGGFASPKNISDNLLFMFSIHSPRTDRYEWLWQGDLGLRWALHAQSEHLPDIRGLVTWSPLYWSINHFLMLLDMLDCYFWCFPPQKAAKVPLNKESATA